MNLKKGTFLASDLWIFHFLWKFSFVTDFSIFAEKQILISHYSKFTRKNFWLYWFHNAQPNQLQLSVLYFVELTLSLCDDLGGAGKLRRPCLTDGCLAPPFSSRKLSSGSSCWIIWEGGIMKEIQLKLGKKLSRELMKGTGLVYLDHSLSFILFQMYFFEYMGKVQAISQLE